MSISLYDLLDVAPDASADEIRAAWRSAVADLDPTDRRFAVYNEAGSVLLDPTRRAAYDGERAAEGAGETAAAESAPVAPAESAPVAPAESAPVAAPSHEPSAAEGLSRAERRIGKQARRKARKDARAAAAGPTAGDEPARTRRSVPAWTLAVLALVLVALVSVSVYLAVAVPSDDAIDAASSEAQSAAERAIVPVLSYDYRTLEDDGETARDWMTENYFSENYEPLFAQIQETAPETETVVRTEVVASALVRSGEDRVQVLLFVDRPTRNKSLDGPVVYKDQVRVTMEKVGDRWLIDQLCTTASCES